MKTTRDVISRRDWERILDSEDGDREAQLRAALEQWEGGDTCERIEVAFCESGRLADDPDPRPTFRPLG